jgi:putative flippase GtrA
MVVLEGISRPMRNFPVRTFGRFLVVGALNSAVGYALFAVLVLAGVVPEVALLIATILGVLFNFTTTGHFVFGSHDRSRIWRFAGVYAAIYLLNALALHYLTYAGMAPLLAQLLLTPAAAIAAFLALRGFVFRENLL